VRLAIASVAIIQRWTVLGKPENKYRSARGNPHLYFSPDAGVFLEDAEVPVFFAEAEKSALAITAAARREGLPVIVIATGGCFGWRGTVGKRVAENGERVDEKGMLPDFGLVKWEARDIRIAFDANASSNPDVARSRRWLASELTKRGAYVRYVELPPGNGINGPDDYIARYGHRAFLDLVRDAKEPPAVPFARSDSGNAEYFSEQYAGELLYDHHAGQWFQWDKHHWKPDTTQEVIRLAKQAMRQRQADGLGIVNEATRRDELKWSAQSESAARLFSLVQLAQSSHGMKVAGNEWDMNPMLLGVKNGVVDLATGLLRDGDPGDMISCVAPVVYDPRATCPRWERFIAEIFRPYPEIAAYIQRVMGYTLTGLTTEHVMWIFYGVGSNGKSTFLETLKKNVFGDKSGLSATIPFPSDSKSDSEENYAKATLARARIITASETKRQKQLNEQLVKSLTGGDEVYARKIFASPITFRPQGKIFLLVNHRPVVKDNSVGMWRRLKLIPFEEQFPVDTKLSDVLAAEAPGILQWLLRGCLDWQRDGLRQPDSVSAATDDYRREQDHLHAFFADRCVIADGFSVKAGELFAAYEEWARLQVKPEELLSSRTFPDSMKQAGFKRDDTSRHRIYYGIRLKTADERNVTQTDDIGDADEAA
jgi:putative DNA primase/helicase